MTKNEQIASIMLEAAELLKNDNERELLNEGIARDNYKSIVADSKNIKNGIPKEFMNGTMDKNKAENCYNKIINDLDNLNEKAKEMPKESFGDRFLTAMTSKYAALMMLFTPLIGASIQLSDEKKYGVDNNINKLQALRAIDKAKQKITKIYNKFYN